MIHALTTLGRPATRCYGCSDDTGLFGISTLNLLGEKIWKSKSPTSKCYKATWEF